MSKNTRRLAAKASLGGLILILGVALVVYSVLLLTSSNFLSAGELALSPIIKWILLAIGIVASIIGIVIAWINSNKARRARVDERDYKHVEPTQKKVEQPQAVSTANAFATQNDSITAPLVAAELPVSAPAQTIDQKFEQIAKMDKSQYVVYIARLFSQKGYSVKLTPVIDNYGIDMLVTKSGSTYAVACLQANKVVSAEDFSYMVDSVLNYTANTCLILTNTYFNKQAVDYAKANNFLLVDRSALIDNFMR